VTRRRGSDDTAPLTAARVLPAAGTAGRLGRMRARWGAGQWTRPATGLTVVTGLLVLLGLVMTFSASIVDAAEAGDAFGVFRRQVVWVTIGLVAFCFTVRLDPRLWRRLAWPAMALSVVLLALVLTPVGLERFGAQSWIGVGPISVQPSELAKLALLLWLADVLERKRPRDGGLHTTEHLLIPALPVLGIVGVLVMLQPDLGTGIILGLVVAAVLWIEGLRGRLVASFGVVATLVVAALVAGAGYRMDRITGWLDPSADPLGTGFQLTQSLSAMADGGVFGLGLGASRAKWNFLPNADNDFIFAIIAEELGLIGAVATVALFVALLHLGLGVAYRAEGGFSRTVAAAVTAWTVGQAFFNIGTVTGLLPITGITLPLVSTGGSSLVTTMVALGILVAIARQPATAVARPPVNGRARRPATRADRQPAAGTARVPAAGATRRGRR
jgi:cell division protein FtsW